MGDPKHMDRTLRLVPPTNSPSAPKMIAKEQLFALLELAHDQYQAQYREAIASYSARFATSAPEVKAKVGYAPEPYCFFVFDLASGSVEPPDVSEVIVAPLHTDEVAAQVTPKLRVTLRPFAWNVVRLWSPMMPTKWPALESWTVKWLDPNDERTKVPDLSGIIHHVEEPQPFKGGFGTGIDFGSAPVEALKELLQLAESAGMRELTVDSIPLPPPGIHRLEMRKK
jgi:hypothetical protein